MKITIESMKSSMEIETPTNEEIVKACDEFESYESRDVMYKVALTHMRDYWGDSVKMTDAVGVLLLTWNKAFYRFGNFNMARLEESIIKNMNALNRFKDRTILSLSDTDEEEIKTLFNDFNVSLQIDSDNKSRGRKSPVSVAKALHLFAPNFFPLWDKQIAIIYGFDYSTKPEDKYFDFCKKTKDMCDKIKDYELPSEKTIVKIIDEYNYSKYTKKWI